MSRVLRAGVVAGGGGAPDYLWVQSAVPLLVVNDVADAETVLEADVDERFFAGPWSMRVRADFLSSELVFRYPWARTSDFYMLKKNASGEYRSRHDAVNRDLTTVSHGVGDELDLIWDPWFGLEFAVDVIGGTRYTLAIPGPTTVADCVFGTPTGNQVELTSAGAGLPVLANSDWIAIRGAADPANDGMYQVNDLSPTTSAVTVDKYRGNPIASAAASTPVQDAPMVPGDVFVGMGFLSNLPWNGLIYPPTPL